MKPEVTHFYQLLLLPDLFILLLFIGSDYYHQRHCGLNHFLMEAWMSHIILFS